MDVGKVKWKIESEDLNQNKRTSDSMFSLFWVYETRRKGKEERMRKRKEKKRKEKKRKEKKRKEKKRKEKKRKEKTRMKEKR
jgi:hypothetical protein